MPRELILDYDLLRGLPGDLAERVQTLIAQGDGWQPKGKPIKMKINEAEVLVQQMVKYDR